MPTSTSGTAQDGPVARPTTTPDPATVSLERGDALPPLPADLSRSAQDTPITDVPVAQPTPATATATPTAMAYDDLPPLPADLGSTPSIAESAATAAQRTAVPLRAAVPAEITVNIPSAQPAETAPAQIRDESLPLLPTGVEERTAPTGLARDGSASTLSPTSPATVLPAGSDPHAVPAPPASPATVLPAGSDPLAVPALIATEPRPLSSPNAASAPTAPVSPSYPTDEP